MSLVAWIVVCFVFAIATARKPVIGLSAVLVVWVLLPYTASQLVTNLDPTTPIGSVHPGTWLVFVLFVVTLLARPRTLWNELQSRAVVYLVLVVVIGVAFLTTTVKLKLGFSIGMMNTLIGPLFYLLLIRAYLTDRREGWKALRNVVLVLSAGEAVLALVQTLTHHIIVYESYFIQYVYWYDPSTFSRGLGTLDQPLTLSMLLAASAFLLMSVKNIVLRYGTLALFIGGILASQSRTGLIIALVAGVAVLLSERRGPLISTLAVLIFAVSSVFILSTNIGSDSITRFSNDSGSNAARTEAYSYFYAHVLNTPVFGGGYGSSALLRADGTLGSSIENGYFIYALDIGVASTLLLLLAQAALILRARPEKPFAGSRLAAIAAVVGGFSFSSIATQSVAGFIIFFMIALVGYSSVKTTTVAEEDVIVRDLGREPIERPVSHSITSRSVRNERPQGRHA